jgi:hypothetical protein
MRYNPWYKYFVQQVRAITTCAPFSSLPTANSQLTSLYDLILYNEKAQLRLGAAGNTTIM